MSWRALMRTERAMTGLIVLAVLRTGFCSGHITPSRVLQGNPWSPSGNPCLVNGLLAAGFPGAYKVFLRQLVCSLRVTAAAVSTSHLARSLTRAWKESDLSRSGSVCKRRIR